MANGHLGSRRDENGEKGGSGKEETDKLTYLVRFLLSHFPDLALSDALRGNEGQIGIADANLIIILKRVRFVDFTVIDEGSVAR